CFTSYPNYRAPPTLSSDVPGLRPAASLRQEVFLMSSTLAALSDDLAGAVERAAPFVVAVNGGGRIPSSGVLWRAGVVVTSEHSLKRDDDIGVILADGRKIAATLAGRDPGTDVAV